MLGKEKCRILKQIRQRIADENDIPFVTRECSFRGECRGSCPRCESELRYLEKQLALRASLGKRAAVAALCASVSLGAAACSPVGGRGSGVETELSGMIAYEEPADTPRPGIEATTGEIAWPEETKEPAGKKSAREAQLPPEPTDAAPVWVELTGDVAWIPEESDG